MNPLKMKNRVKFTLDGAGIVIIRCAVRALEQDGAVTDQVKVSCNDIIAVLDQGLKIVAAFTDADLAELDAALRENRSPVFNVEESKIIITPSFNKGRTPNGN